MGNKQGLSSLFLSLTHSITINADVWAIIAAFFIAYSLLCGGIILEQIVVVFIVEAIVPRQYCSAEGNTFHGEFFKIGSCN